MREENNPLCQTINADAFRDEYSCDRAQVSNERYVSFIISGRRFPEIAWSMSSQENDRGYNAAINCHFLEHALRFNAPGVGKRVDSFLNPSGTTFIDY